MNDTKFKYNDHIIIKYGFHRTMSGKVIDQKKTKQIIGEGELQYKIKTDVGNIEVWVFEDQIEIVGRK
jgi:hypothetical protein